MGDGRLYGGLVIELPAFAPVGLSTRVSGIAEVREILSEIREGLPLPISRVRSSTRVGPPSPGGPSSRSSEA